MQIQANIKALQMSPRKVNVVASLVRGRTVEDALVILEHTPRRTAKPIADLLMSVKANAQANHNMKADDLIITTLDVGPGPSMKRFKPAAHGRALPFKKRSARVRVVVEGAERIKKTATKVKAEEKKAYKAPTDASTKTSKKQEAK